MRRSDRRRGAAGYVLLLGAASVTGTIGGCASPGQGLAGRPSLSLRERAIEGLKRGVAYPDNPAVRAGAVEAFQDGAPEAGLAWIRSSLLDPHPGVRFAGCMALGMLKDSGAAEAIRLRLDDANPSVRAAALFAWHRLGHSERTGELAELLLTHPDSLVRCNAAMLLGRLADPSAAPILAQVMRDKDLRVQDHALEAMAMLDVSEAVSQLKFLANSGVGSQEAFAVAALSATRKAEHEELLRAKLTTAQHLETRLAAARGLGLLGRADGLDIALRALSFNRPRREEPDDPPEAQKVRIRSMAVLALAAIGDPVALPPLEKIMTQGDDPRLQVACAGAILQILRRNPTPAAAVHSARERP